MCGIIGGNWFTSKKQTHTHLQKIIHRGRNASAVEKINNLYVGHNRLSIQDLSDTANQPMWNGDKTICLIYNGELWDSTYTKELKEKITIPFRTNSDTEIILNGYEQFGVIGWFDEGDVFEKATFSDKGDPYLEYPKNFYTLEDLELDKLINPERRVNYGMFFAK